MITAVDNANEDDNAEVGIVPAVDEGGFQGSGAVALRGWDLGDDRFKHVLDTDAGLGAGENGFRRVDANDVLDLFAHHFGFGGG